MAYLHDAMTDGAILPLPQKHQTDHNNSCYSHRDHQQANQCTAAEAEVLSQGAVGLLMGWNGDEGDMENSEETIYAQLTTDAVQSSEL